MVFEWDNDGTRWGIFRQAMFDYQLNMSNCVMDEAYV